MPSRRSHPGFLDNVYQIVIASRSTPGAVDPSTIWSLTGSRKHVVAACEKPSPAPTIHGEVNQSREI